MFPSETGISFFFLVKFEGREGIERSNCLKNRKERGCKKEGGGTFLG